MTDLPLFELKRGDAATLLPLVPDESVDLILTDPPYAREFEHVWSILAAHARRVLKPTGYLATLCGHYQMPFVIRELLASGLHWLWPCIVPNNNQPIMQGYRVKVSYKPFLVFRKDPRSRPSRIMTDNFGLRILTKAWKEAKDAHRWGQAESIFYEPIQCLTPPGGVVLDPFLGGGSIGVAAVRLGRRFYGIELDPVPFDKALFRINAALLETQTCPTTSEPIPPPTTPATSALPPESQASGPSTGCSPPAASGSTSDIPTDTPSP